MGWDEMMSGGMDEWEVFCFECGMCEWLILDGHLIRGAVVYRVDITIDELSVHELCCMFLCFVCVFVRSFGNMGFTVV